MHSTLFSEQLRIGPEWLEVFLLGKPFGHRVMLHSSFGITRSYIHNTLFSWQPMIGPDKLACLCFASLPSNT